MTDVPYRLSTISVVCFFSFLYNSHHVLLKDTFFFIRVIVRFTKGISFTPVPTFLSRTAYKNIHEKKM